MNFKNTNLKNLIGIVLISLMSFTVEFSSGQSVLLDDFNRPDNNVVGASWVETETVAGTGATISSNMLRLASTTSGRDYTTYDVSALYNTVLSTNTGILTWEFNVRQSRPDPSGFDNVNYGVAFVLGCTTGNFMTGSGYAIVLGNTGSGDNTRLVKFGAGILNSAALVNIIAPANDYGAEYLTIKVTYNPIGNSWTLYTASSAAAPFIDPLAAVYTNVGTATDATYTGNDLLYLGCFWNHSTSASEAALFDNIRIPTACILDAEPTVQSSALNFTAVGANAMTLNWTRGNGTECIIIGRSGSAVTATPTDGAVYSANSIFGSGTAISPGQFVIYSGSASTISITGLSATTTYYFSIFEFKGSGCTANFLIPSPATGSATTIGCILASEPTIPSSAISVISTMPNSIKLNWTRGNGAYCMVICRGGSAVTSVPIDGISYTANASYGLGSTTAAGDYVVYSGTSNNVLVQGLMPGTAYYFSVFEMNGTGCNTNYLINPSSTSGTTTPVVAYINYFGNLHCHSDYSDGDVDNICPGAGSPTCCYGKGMLANYFSWMGISDHNHNEGPVMTPAKYASGVSEASAWNGSNPTFSAMYGMEWGTISTGGHVTIYGINQLLGWNSGNYDVFVAKGDYNTIFNMVASTSGAFTTLCHPGSTDFGNLLTLPYNATYDNAIIGTAVKNGPAFSTNTTYTDPSASFYVTYWNSLLAKGYHLGPTMDMDNHNSATMGKSNQERTVVLAPSLSPANISEALLNMRFYSTEDYNLSVSYDINGIFPLGSIVTQTVNPTINVSTTDGNGETTTGIKIYYGISGSGSAPTVLTSVSAASLSYTHSFATGTYYYYAEITQADGNKAYTSPIWYTKITTPLPIELITFDGSFTSKGNLLKWITASETNNDYFSLERSSDGISFNAITKIKGAGNSTKNLDYDFLDAWAPEGINYYRLKQVDFDGKFSYSNIIAIRSLKNEELFLIYPNPTNGSFIVTVKDIFNGGYDLKISNSIGQVVFSLKNSMVEQQVLDLDLREGIYTISLVINEQAYNRKLVIQQK